VYQKLRPHVDLLNICILKSQTAAEGDYCFNKYKNDIETSYKPALKNILLEF